MVRFNRVKGFASHGSRGTKRPNVLHLRVAFNDRQGFYIGFSTDLKRRLSEHKRGASFATKSRGPWKLIYYEAYTEREDAENREKFLKSGAGRRLKLGRFPHSLAASLAALPSMSLIPFAPIPAHPITSLSPRKRLRLTRL
jgi:putative endonuclease